MILTGPFSSGIDYLGDVEQIMSENNQEYSIQINDTELYKNQYLRFLMRQELHISHFQTIMVLVCIDGEYELLPMKPHARYIYEFVEYRVKLSRSKLEGKSGMTLYFRYYVMGKSMMYLKELMFGERLEDDAIYPDTGFVIQNNGSGITSPLSGFVPAPAGDIVTIKAYPYPMCRIKYVAFEGDICNEDGIKYPSYYNLTGDEFKVQSMTPFDKGKVIVYFEEE